MANAVELMGRAGVINVGSHALDVVARSFAAGEDLRISEARADAMRTAEVRAEALRAAEVERVSIGAVEARKGESWQC